MSELLEDYILVDGEIISLNLNLDYQLAGSVPTRQAIVQLAVRKRISATKWVPCQVQLQFQQLRRISVFEDFSTAGYSDIVLQQLLDTTWYLSLDPHGNTGEPHAQDNLVLIANLLIIEEL